MASANFDLRFKKDSRDGFGARLGYTNTGFVGDDKWISAFPLGINYVHGKGRCGLLLGFTTTFAVIPKNTDSWDYKSTVFAPEIGYRFRPIQQGLGLQLTWTRLFNTVDATKLAWFGLLFKEQTVGTNFAIE
ncbi:hypothetical protein [Sphingobacterium corticibacter]|uniref:Uncharacterized protein n=1 Tax=Sphingobacterium corticibacter TaxID=2171749 RepID=A0A2T8HFQ7_9SPHI|nr:hypothetical protein [Sphingobacterium corticibacter]PVH24278.1 hypothetical protein DC487_14425 [Sphingobacterium corticibacter]